MMKRLTTLLLLVMALTLTACGGPGENPENETEPSAPQTATAEPETEISKEMLAPFRKTATIEETVLLDEDGVRVTATGLEYTNHSADLKLTIENNSQQDLSVSSGSLVYGCNSINGMMAADGYLNCDVSAGKKAMDAISFHEQTLQLCGIQEIANMELGLTVTDKNYDSTNYPPKEIRTSAWSDAADGANFQDTITGAAAQNTFEYEVLHFDAKRFYEESDMAILSQTLIRNAGGEQMLLLEAENQGDTMKVLSVGDIALNGLVVEAGPWTRQLLTPGKRGILSVDLTAALEGPYWELYGVDGVGSIQFTVQQYGMDGLPLGEKKSVEIVCGEEKTFDHSGELVYQENEAAILLKSVIEPEEGDGHYWNVMLLAENSGQEPLKLEIPFQTLSVNGFMVDNFGGHWELQAGQSAVMELRLDKTDLEEIGVTTADQITQMEFGLELRRGKTKVDDTTIQLTFNEKG